MLNVICLIAVLMTRQPPASHPHSSITSPLVICRSCPKGCHTNKYGTTSELCQLSQVSSSGKKWKSHTFAPLCFLRILRRKLDKPLTSQEETHFLTITSSHYRFLVRLHICSLATFYFRDSADFFPSATSFGIFPSSTRHLSSSPPVPDGLTTTLPASDPTPPP